MFKIDSSGDLKHVWELSLDVIVDNEIEITAKQHDDNSRYLLVTLTADGETVEIPSDYTPYLRGLKADGWGTLTAGSIENGKAYIELTDSALFAAGKLKADVAVEADGEIILSTMPFIIDVIETPYDGDDIPQSPDVLSMIIREIGDSARTASENAAKVLNARMDTFTRLAEGSTTGDAELEDGRIGIDGKVYENIGGAIRGQVEQITSRGIGICYTASRTMTNSTYINVNFEKINVSAETFIEVYPESVSGEEENLRQVRIEGIPDGDDTSVRETLAESVPVDEWTIVPVPNDYETIRFAYLFNGNVTATAYSKLTINAEIKRDIRNNDYLFEPRRLQTAAHRGARDFFPENSMPAFEKACQLGYDWIWLATCRQSASGTWYCIHDTTVDRTTNGSGNVKNLTDEELGELHLRYYDTEYPELRIPTVVDAVTLIRRYGKKIVFGLGSLSTGRAEWMSYVKLIKSLGMDHAVFYGTEAQVVELKYFSDNWHGCVYLETLDADDVTALIDRLYAAKLTNCSIEIPFTTVNEGLVDYAHQHGYNFFCSSVPTGSEQAAAFETMKSWRVDIAQGIFEFEEANT